MTGKIILLINLFAFSINVTAQYHPGCAQQVAYYYGSFNLCNNDPWVLVFEDNFDVNSLDLTKWSTVEGVNRDVYFKLEKTWKQPQNVLVENGKLKILTKYEPKYNMTYSVWLPDQGTTWFTNDFNYTTGEIWTKYKFPYGKFEAKVKIPSGKGFWPAFWLHGGNPVYNEIDIFEFMENKPDLLKMTSHYDYDGTGDLYSCVVSYNGSDFSTIDHIYTLIWEENKMEWYVDGNLRRIDYQYYTVIGQAIECSIIGGRYYLRSKSYPKNPMAIIFDTVCETGNNAPDSSTPFPANLEVDWVRYYQRKPCEDINITNQSQFPISSENYNVIVGDNVSITNSFNVNSGQQLEIIGDNSIMLSSGFSINLGATFEAKVDPSIFN